MSLFHANTPRPERPAQERLPRACIVIAVMAVLCALLTLLFRLYTPFADGFNAYISQPIRVFLSWLTHLLPFSLAEALLLLSPVALVLIIVHAVRRYCSSWRAVGMYFLRLLSAAGTVFIAFVLVFNAGYFTSTLDSEHRLNLDRRAVSADELYTTASHLAAKLVEESDNVRFIRV